MILHLSPPLKWHWFDGAKWIVWHNWASEWKREREKSDRAGDLTQTCRYSKRLFHGRERWTEIMGGGGVLWMVASSLLLLCLWTIVRQVSQAGPLLSLLLPFFFGYLFSFCGIFAFVLLSSLELFFRLDGCSSERDRHWYGHSHSPALLFSPFCLVLMKSAYCCPFWLANLCRYKNNIVLSRQFTFSFFLLFFYLILIVPRPDERPLEHHLQICSYTDKFFIFPCLSALFFTNIT